MGFFDLFSRPREERNVSGTTFTLSDPRAAEFLFGVSNGTFSGETVTEDIALGVPAISAAIQTIASTIAGLPLHYFRTEGETRVKASKDPLYRIVHDLVNDKSGLTSYAWRLWMIRRLMLAGRAFTFIERNKAGRVMRLWPLENSRIVIEIKDGVRSYRYRQDNGRTDVFAATEIIDLVWQPTADGHGHIDPIHQNRNSIAAMIAAERSASRIFQNGGIPPFLIQSTKGVAPMSPAAQQRAEGDFDAKLKQLAHDGKNGLKVDDVEIKTIGLDNEKLQLLGTRQWMVTEVARIWNLPPTFIQDHSRSTFSNTESLNIHFSQYTILPLINLIEAELNSKLFVNWSNEIRFNMSALERADFAKRMQGYQTGINCGVYTINEARILEGRPALPGGDELMIQSGTLPVDDLPAEPEPQAENQPEQEPDEPAGDTDV